MDSKRNRVTNGILALLMATVIACGTVQGASGKTGSGSSGGDVYITSDEHGTGMRTSNNPGGPAVAPTTDGFGPSLQP